MKILEINELCSQNFDVVFVNALKQFWQTTRCFQCFGSPKKESLFLFVKGCKVTYTDKTGRTLVANSGDVVYTPAGSEYIATLSDFKVGSSHTVGINFRLLDSSGELLLLSDGVHIFHSGENANLGLLFSKALRLEASGDILGRRILLMEILHTLASHSSVGKADECISHALEYLSENIEKNPRISNLAALCNVSEVYFRKRFKEYLGVSPVEYRNSLRLERACSYLEYGDISVQEISDTLGYSTVSHFIKEFRSKYGCTPLKYKKKQ